MSTLIVHVCTTMEAHVMHAQFHDLTLSATAPIIIIKVYC